MIYVMSYNFYNIYKWLIIFIGRLGVMNMIYIIRQQQNLKIPTNFITYTLIVYGKLLK